MGFALGLLRCRAFCSGSASQPGAESHLLQVSPDWNIRLHSVQVPYEEYPLIHTRQNPSWDQFKKRGNAVLRYGDHFQRVCNSSAASNCSAAEVQFLQIYTDASLYGFLA
jgi:hypothetical protein